MDDLLSKIAEESGDFGAPPGDPREDRQRVRHFGLGVHRGEGGTGVLDRAEGRPDDRFPCGPEGGREVGLQVRGARSREGGGENGALPRAPSAAPRQERGPQLARGGGVPLGSLGESGGIPRQILGCAFRGGLHLLQLEHPSSRPLHRGEGSPDPRGPLPGEISGNIPFRPGTKRRSGEPGAPGSRGGPLGYARDLAPARCRFRSTRVLPLSTGRLVDPPASPSVPGCRRSKPKERGRREGTARRGGSAAGRPTSGAPLRGCGAIAAPARCRFRSPGTFPWGDIPISGITLRSVPPLTGKECPRPFAPQAASRNPSRLRLLAPGAAHGYVAVIM